MLGSCRKRTPFGCHPLRMSGPRALRFEATCVGQSTCENDPRQVRTEAEQLSRSKGPLRPAASHVGDESIRADHVARQIRAIVLAPFLSRR